MNSTEAASILPIYQEQLYTDFAETESSRDSHPKVLLIVNGLEWSSDGDNLLQKMMLACQVEASDYLVVKQQGSQLDIRSLQVYNTETLILFGIQVQQEHFRLNKKTYTPFRFHQYKWLLADGIESILKEASLKSKLWNEGLKPLFGL